MNYKHGLPFSEILGDNLNDLLQRIDLKKAVLIIIDGGVGEGKTTMLVEVLDHINKIRGFPPIAMDGPQLAMGGVDFLKKMRVCYESKLPCIGYDEAGDFNKRGSLTSFNAMLNRTFETFRAFKCVVILALPNFGVLDNQLFDNHIPRMLLHLHSRTVNSGNFDAYDLRGMEWLKYWQAKSPIKSYCWHRVFPNFYGHFLDLDPDRSLELDKVSTKNKLNILRKSEIKIEGLLTYPELATKLMRGIDWVRRSVSNLKIKPTRSVGRIKYFNADALNELSQHLDNVEANDGRGQHRWDKKQEA